MIGNFGLLVLSTSLVILTHGDGQWIQDKKLKDPIAGNMCCGKNDCKKLALDAIKQQADGFLVVKTNEVIPFNRVIWGSPDEHPWRCAFHSGHTRCLIMPNPSF